MLDACGVSTPEDLFAHLPEAVRLNRPLNLAPGISEYEIVDYFRDRAATRTPTATPAFWAPASTTITAPCWWIRSFRAASF